MKPTKEQIIDYAVEVVDYLNRVVMGLELNDTICLPAYKRTAIKDSFLARAKELIFGATREQLEAAYGEIVKTGLKDDVEDIVEDLFRQIGNRAPNDENEKLIETVWFGIV